MIILFILLGLGFLGGGAAAIIDGLPYMVLERGFTQVIIGTVVAVAGVIMLALSQVLAKLRTLENQLAGTTMALSLASAAGVAAHEPTVSLTPAEPEFDRTSGPSAAAAVAGALAGAGLVGAGVAAASAPEPAPEPDPKAEEPDLFGAHLAAVLDPDTTVQPPLQPNDEVSPEAQPASDSKPEPDREEEPAPAAIDIDIDALPVFDPFRPVDPEPSTTAVEPWSPPNELALLPEPSDEPVPVAAAEQENMPEPEPASEPAIEDAPGDPAPALSDIDDPLTPSMPAPLMEGDEFGRLRESLAGLELGPVGGRVEPRFDEPAPTDEVREEDLAAAASWMDSALGRLTPGFDLPDSSEPVLPPQRMEPTFAPVPSWPTLDEEDRPAPSWPPQTREAAAEESATDPENLPGEAEESEPADAPPAPADEAPAASEEGIVGAYQVGEAHFTIYADGSIQARTPDGDYSFASMDELKTYLASEKSRLGA